MSAPTTPVAAAPEPGGEQRDPLATRRPVGTFVALVILAALVLGALGWSGAVAPRLETPGWNESAPTPGERVWTIEVRNAGLAPVEIETATWPAHGLVDVELLVVRSGRRGPAAGGTEADAVPFAPFTLGGGETRMVVLRGALMCPPGTLGATYGLETLTLRVRSAVGRRHRVDVGPGPFGSRGSDHDLSEPCS